MKKLTNDQSGSIVATVVIVLLSLMLIGAGVFAGWAYTGMNDYKFNTNQKISEAVRANTKQVQQEDAANFAEQAKQPYKVFRGSDAFGSVNITYPKTWSLYLVSTNASTPVDLYAAPDIVPTTNDRNSTFALRVQVVASQYSDIVRRYEGQVKQGKVTSTPYSLPKNPAVPGVRLDGQITNDKKGSLVIIPIRDKTLQIWTESEAFLKDFNETILPNATFAQ